MDLIGIEPMTSSMPYWPIETYETEKPAKPAQSAVFATKMLPKFQPVGCGSICGELTRNTVPVGFARCNNTVGS